LKRTVHSTPVFQKKNDLEQVERNSFKKRAWWGEMGIDRK
jgi:hypothetical protein